MKNGEIGDGETSPLIDAEIGTLPSVAVRSNNKTRVVSSTSPTRYQSTMGASNNTANNRDTQLLLSDFADQQNDSDNDDDNNAAALSQHCHMKEEPTNGDNKKARKTLIMASVLCLLFMLGEIVGGYIAGSLAIMTDAAHLLTDFASFLISLFSLFVASRPATRRMSFGWHRAEVLGAFISVFLIWIITGVLVYIAIERIVNKTYEVNGSVMLITAAFGVAVNILMGTILHGSGHGHSHGGAKRGHSHSGNVSNASSSSLDNVAQDGVKLVPSDKHHSSGQNINVRAAFIHVIGDFFQSLGVLIAAYVIYYYPEYAVIDPICTFVFSVLVLITTLAIMRDALNVLMEGSPRGIDFIEVAESLATLKGVQRVHNLRIWSLTMDKVALSVHLAVAQGYDSQEILKSATRLLRRQYGVYECTVQIENYSDDMDECHDCEHPKQ